MQSFKQTNERKSGDKTKTAFYLASANASKIPPQVTSATSWSAFTYTYTYLLFKEESCKALLSRPRKGLQLDRLITNALME